MPSERVYISGIIVARIQEGPEPGVIELQGVIPGVLLAANGATVAAISGTLFWTSCFPDSSRAVHQLRLVLRTDDGRELQEVKRYIQELSDDLVCTRFTPVDLSVPLGKHWLSFEADGIERFALLLWAVPAAD